MQFHKYTIAEIYHAPRPLCLRLARWVGEPSTADPSKGQQWIPLQPGIYTVRRWMFFRKRVIVWGDANNRLMICIWSWDGELGEAQALCQMPAESNWRWVRDLLPTDPLPGAYGPDVAAFVAREVAPQGAVAPPESTLS